MSSITEKKILITVPALANQGGVATFYQSILPHLSKKKHDITTLEIGFAKRKRNLLHPFYDQLRFRKIIRDQKPALVHVNPSLDFKSLIRDGLFVWQAKQKGLPVLVFFHGWNEKFEQLVEKRYLWFFLQSFGRADSFIVLSSEFKKVLKRWGINQPIHLRTTTVDEQLLEDFSINDKLTRLRETATTNILFLARLEREKGAFETVDAVKILLQKNLPVSLSIAGDGSVRKELANYVLSQGFSETNVRFLGYVRGEEKVRALADHDIYCFPTYYGEGLPISMLEAMAFGMPVVTCPVGGIADFFEDSKMGYLVESKDPEEIARMIEAIVCDKEKMLEFGHYNYQYAQENFLTSKVAESLRVIYQNCLGNPPD